MSRRQLFAQFGVLLLTTTILEAILVYLVTTAIHRDYIKTLGQSVYGVPLFAYLIGGAALVAVLVALTTSAMARYAHTQLARRLTPLVAGQYDVAVWLRQQQAAGALGGDIATLLEDLRQKMLRLHQEIARYAKAPVVVAGEQKEAILTKERQRLARELHDSVSQQLFAAMMLLSAVQSGLNETQDPALVTQITTIETVINEAQAEMRALLLHLRPTSLEGKSLKSGIIGLLKELETKIQITITWELEDVHLPTATEDNLFRIVQELLANTLRHAKARHLEVYLQTVAGHVVLRVVDDGVGFDQKAVASAGSYGLANIQERAVSLGGTAKVVSFLNQGTSVEVRIPTQIAVAKESR